MAFPPSRTNLASLFVRLRRKSTHPDCEVNRISAGRKNADAVAGAAWNGLGNPAGSKGYK